jgi:alpha-N-arabinofuranosidase
MNEKQNLQSYTIIIGLACLLGLSASCGSAGLPDVEKSTALFHHFTYKGNDDFYISNPLPGNEYFYTPILPGWYSDPSICTNGRGDYFLVTSTFTYFPGVPLFHSRDLINWKQVGHVLDRESQLVNMKGQSVSGGIFAPAISYNPHNETYYMVTTNVGAGNFFVKAQDPFGSWSDPIMLPEVGGIDPSFFFDEDGKAYIVNNDDAPNNKPEYDGHRTIRIQEFDIEANKTIGPRKVLVNKGAYPQDNPIWIEGPHMYKIDGKYFLMSAEGGTGDGHSEVIFQGDSPMGTFTPWKGNPILTQRHLSSMRANPVTCAGHADLIQTTEGDWWAIFLACRPINNRFENLGRETFLMPVRWSDDGFPYITHGDESILMVLRRAGVTRDSITTFGNFEIEETFANQTLGMEWMTLRSPATELYSLTETPGYLALKCADASTTEKETSAFICRRMQHHKFETTTRMQFEPVDETEAAGLLLFKDETHQYFMAVNRNQEGKCISLWQIGTHGKEILAEQPIADKVKVIDLKVVSMGLTYKFYYSTDLKQWNALNDYADAHHLSTANAGGFTGSVIGMYATKKSKSLCIQPIITSEIKS